MLAQNFKSAADLGITESQADALRKTLVLLETGRLSHVRGTDCFSFNPAGKESFEGQFSMNSWIVNYRECGTVCCIAGTAELISGVSMDDGGKYGGPLYVLFYPNLDPALWDAITLEQAATALRSYLTTGNARWDLAVAANSTAR